MPSSTMSAQVSAEPMMRRRPSNSETISAVMVAFSAKSDLVTST